MVLIGGCAVDPLPGQEDAWCRFCTPQRDQQEFMLAGERAADYCTPRQDYTADFVATAVTDGGAARTAPHVSNLSQTNTSFKRIPLASNVTRNPHPLTVPKQYNHEVAQKQSAQLLSYHEEVCMSWRRASASV